MFVTPLRLRSFYLITFALLSACAPILVAQSAGTGALAGTVTDPSRAVIPMVSVTLTNVDTNQARTAITAADGNYKFSLIPPGTYKVRFSATGFKTAEVPSVKINVTETPVLDQTLEVGSQAEQVTVEAQTEGLQIASSTLGTVVGERTVTALPLSTRNYTQILGLSAGASGGVGNATAFGKGTLDLSVNGNDPGKNNFQMDGVAVGNMTNRATSQDLYGILTGYAAPPADMHMQPGMQYNKYFPGHAIGMPKPLTDGQVEYTDGTPATVDQYGRDVAAFLMWAAEPTLDARKRLGLQVMLFLFVFTALLYFTKKRVWHAVELDPELLEPRPPTEYQR